MSERIEEIKNKVSFQNLFNPNTSVTEERAVIPREDYEWLIEQAKKAERYKKALESIQVRTTSTDRIDLQRITVKALKGED